jgi:DNA-binding PadR family transcriptional regulator
MNPQRPPADADIGPLLPLTPAVLHILLALSDRERHGLGIAEHVETYTGGRIVLGPGTLYGTIRRLLEGRLIEETGEAPAGDREDPRRRYYRLTPLGRRALETETRDLARIVDVARMKRVLRRS